LSEVYDFEGAILEDDDVLRIDSQMKDGKGVEGEEKGYDAAKMG
jgi:hypothetical protein